MPDPLSIGAAVTAAAGVAERILDVTGVRKRVAAVETAIAEVRTLAGVVAADVAKLRADVEALAARLTRRENGTGSQRATVIPAAPSPDTDRRLSEAERRITALEEQADERARWERTIAADVARIEGRLSARVRRASERESDG